MDLILWRHADAVDGSPDMTRKLTPKGHRQAAEVAKWLKKHLPPDTRVVVSPATRAQETVRALTDHFETDASLAPGAMPEAVLKAAGWPEAARTVLVVGHQPTLGEVAAHLMAEEPRAWSLRKGAFVWLEHRVRDAGSEVVLRAALSPDLL